MPCAALSSENSAAFGPDARRDHFRPKAITTHKLIQFCIRAHSRLFAVLNMVLSKGVLRFRPRQLYCVPAQFRCLNIFISRKLLGWHIFKPRDELAQIHAKRFQSQPRKIRRRDFELHERVLQMLHRAVMNAAPELMMAGRGLNQTLNKKTPRLGVASPNLLPRFMRFPKLAGIEQREACFQIFAIFRLKLRREPGGVRGRGAQLVLRPGQVR